MAGNKNSGQHLKKEAMLVSSLAREHTEAAVKKLAKLMESAESEVAQVQACNALLDRGWGKPMQGITHEGNPDNPVLTELIVKFTT